MGKGLRAVGSRPRHGVVGRPAGGAPERREPGASGGQRPGASHATCRDFGQDRPTDDDRVRFGFKRKEKEPKEAQETHEILKKLPEKRPFSIVASMQISFNSIRIPKKNYKSAKLPSEASITSSGAPSSDFDVQRLLERTLGDPDDVLPVLRLKLTAGKYDFKALSGRFEPFLSRF